MIHENNAAGDNVNKAFMLMLTDSAKTFSEYAGNYQTYAERFKNACHLPSTIEATHKNGLVGKAGDLKRLAELNHSAAEFFLNAARKLANGVSENEILEGLRNYNTFFTDQLKSEENGMKHTLSSLMKTL